MTSVLTPMAAAAAGLAVLCLVQFVLLWKLARSTRVTADASARVAQLTAALALLTDTTEEGFVNVAAELERLGARPMATGGTRRATTRRIAAAARKGKAIEDIAGAESLSESEVRLHLGLETAAEPVTARDADETDEAGPGVLDDLERWMNALTTSRRPRAARHVAQRV
jgi:hypothetical protein